MAITDRLILFVISAFDFVLSLYLILVLVSVVLSWVRPDPNHPIVSFLRMVTEPLFRRVRKILPRFFWRSGIDFSPMVVFLVIYFIQFVILAELREWVIGL